MPRKRIFAAVKIHANQTLVTVIENSRRQLANEKIRWVNTENIHITLKFFGETEIAHIPAINDALAQAATRQQPFDLELSEAGTFGGFRNPKVIWLGIRPLQPLATFYHHINKELQPLGFEPEKRAFRPHLTIGRIKHLHDKRRLRTAVEAVGTQSLLSETITAFHLFESRLQPQGAVYSILQSFDLRRIES